MFYSWSTSDFSLFFLFFYGSLTATIRMTSTKKKEVMHPVYDWKDKTVAAYCPKDKITVDIGTNLCIICIPTFFFFFLCLLIAFTLIVDQYFYRVRSTLFLCFQCLSCFQWAGLFTSCHDSTILPVASFRFFTSPSNHAIPLLTPTPCSFLGIKKSAKMKDMNHFKYLTSFLISHVT